jgi:RNA polymerase sigma factor (sigma-70 family)
MESSKMNRTIQLLGRGVLLQNGAGLSDRQLLEDFVSRGDSAALATLVYRHGPMVWGVCRRVLSNHHDAEDAFQATFLVLVRRAASIASRELIANWLYGVAHRTALKARASSAKRKTRESQVTEMPERAVPQQDLWKDLQPLLDHELSRLPDKYRSVIVLCDLEGKTRKEAARQLKLPEGTVGSRLARSRARLAKRLTRHGLLVSGGLLASILSQHMASAAMPSSVVACTMKTAVVFMTGKTADLLSTRVSTLAERVLKSMLLVKLKITMTMLVIATAAGVGVGGQIYRTQAAESTSGNAHSEGQVKSQVTDELSKLQGTWIVVAAEEQGRTVLEEKIKAKAVRLLITADRFALKRGGQAESLEGRLTIDPTKRPKTMDWSAVKPDDTKAIKVEGIYRLQADTLIFCYGEKRPAEFKTSADLELDQRMYTFKRETKDAKQFPAASTTPQDAGKTDRETIQGE